MSGSRRKPGPLGAIRRRLPGVAAGAWIFDGRDPVADHVGHLGRWMEREELAVDQLTDERGRAFLAEYRSDRRHLPSSSVWPLLEYLRRASFP